MFFFACHSVSLCVGSMEHMVQTFMMHMASQVLMELGQHLLLLWPMPLAVFPMTRSKQQSQLSSTK